MTKKQITDLALMGVFSALSIIVLTVLRVPLIPTASWLEYDMADVPVLLIAMMINPYAGIAVLGVVCLIQAFFFGGNGFFGFFMHFVASGLMVVIMGGVYAKWKKILPNMIIAAIASTIAMTAMMIPLNMVITPILFGTPTSAVVQLIVPALLPFNLIKAGLNCTITLILFSAIKPLTKFIYR